MHAHLPPQQVWQRSRDEALREMQCCDGGWRQRRRGRKEPSCGRILRNKPSEQSSDGGPWGRLPSSVPARCVISRPRQGLGSQTQVGTGAQPGPSDSSNKEGCHTRVPRRLQDEQLRLKEKRVLAGAGAERRHERASSVCPVVVRTAKADKPHLSIAAACHSAIRAAAGSRSSRCHELLVLMLLHPQCCGSRGSRHHGDEMHREAPARLPEVQRSGATEWIVELGAKWVQDEVAFVEDSNGACASNIRAPKHAQDRTNAIRGS